MRTALPTVFSQKLLCEKETNSCGKTFYLCLLIVAVIRPLLNGSAHELAIVRDSST